MSGPPPKGKPPPRKPMTDEAAFAWLRSKGRWLGETIHANDAVAHYRYDETICTLSPHRGLYSLYTHRLPTAGDRSAKSYSHLSPMRRSAKWSTVA